MQSEYFLRAEFDTEFSSAEETVSGLRQWLSCTAGCVAKMWRDDDFVQSDLQTLRAKGNVPNLVPLTIQNLDTALIDAQSFSRMSATSYLMAREGVYEGPYVEFSAFAPNGFGPSKLVRVSTSFPEQEAIENGDAFRYRMSLIHRYADRWAPRFGHVSYSLNGNPPTALELGLRTNAGEDIKQIRTWARGYSWVTVLSDALVERLGGSQQLEESRAFTKVERLTNGSVWLQATDTWPEYDMDAVRRVFEAVRPVILRGEPRASNLRRFQPSMPPELVILESA